MYSLGRIFIGTLLATFLILRCTCAPSYAADAVPAGTEALLLQEDWQKLFAKLNKPEPNAVEHLLLGHAALLLNHNDASLCHFVAAASADSIAAWSQWTDEFLRDHPEAPIAWYFAGDASARNNHPDKAVNQFSKALALSQSHVSSLNARGVAFAAQGKWDAAGDDFERAIAVQPRLADARANMGMIYVQQRQAPDAAERYFHEAINISPEFSLARNGIAASLAGQGKLSEAAQRLQAIMLENPCVGVAALNLAMVRVTIAKAAYDDAERLVAEATPGTEMYKNAIVTQKQANSILNSTKLPLDSMYQDLVHSPEGRARTITSQLQSLNEKQLSLTNQLNGASLFGAGIHSVNLWLGITSKAFEVPAAVKPVVGTTDTATQTYIQSMREKLSGTGDQMRLLGGQLAALHNQMRGTAVPPGGAELQFNEPVKDRGDWPAITWPGLTYVVPPVTQ
jgi:tetratricopeptide (TPR) repeat protein